MTDIHIRTFAERRLVPRTFLRTSVPARVIWIRGKKDVVSVRVFVSLDKIRRRGAARTIAWKRIPDFPARGGGGGGKERPFLPRLARRVS